MYQTITAVWALKFWNVVRIQKVSSKAAFSHPYARMKPHLMGMWLPLEPIVFPSHAHTYEKLIDLRGSPWLGCCHLSAGLPVSFSTEAAVLRVWVIVWVSVCVCVLHLLSYILTQHLPKCQTNSDLKLLLYISIDRRLPQSGEAFISGFAFTRESFANSIEWNKRLIGVREAENMNSLQRKLMEMDSQAREG